MRASVRIPKVPAIFLFAAVVACSQDTPKPVTWVKNDNQLIEPVPKVPKWKGPERPMADLDSLIDAIPVSKKFFTEQRFVSTPGKPFMTGHEPRLVYFYPHLADMDLPMHVGDTVENVCDSRLRLSENLELLHETGKPRRSVLTEAQTDTLLSILRSERSCEKVSAACFDPRHTFVMYDASGPMTAYAQVCFSCMNIRAAGCEGCTFDGLLCPEDWQRLERLTAAIVNDGEQVFRKH